MEHPENSNEYKGLAVNAGVEQPSIVNPYLKRGRFKRHEMSVGEMVEGILKGNITVLSQAVTLIESVNPDHYAKAQEVIEKCLPHSGQSIRIGISGVPGAGKSTSIDQFGLHVLDRTGGKLAVLAIDPSSERSKGSILGDKTRMEKLSVRQDAFIRPSPTAGSLGGVARKTRESIILCEAAGFDKIFVGRRLRTFYAVISKKQLLFLQSEKRIQLCLFISIGISLCCKRLLYSLCCCWLLANWYICMVFMTVYGVMVNERGRVA